MSTAEIVRQMVRGACSGLLIDGSTRGNVGRAVWVATTMAGIPVIGSSQSPPEAPVTLVLAARPDLDHGPAAVNCTGLLASPGEEIRARFERLCVVDARVRPWLLKPSGISMIGADGILQCLDVHAYPLELTRQVGAADDQSPLVAGNETAVLEHLNGDHPELVAALAVNVLGEVPGDWRLVGADPEGLDLRAQRSRRRLKFVTPAWTFQALRAQLKSLLAAKSSQAATGLGQD